MCVYLCVCVCVCVFVCVFVCYIHVNVYLCVSECMHTLHVCCYYQLESKPWRRSLTMSNQKSEMKAQYCGQQEMIDRIIPITDP